MKIRIWQDEGRLNTQRRKEAVDLKREIERRVPTEESAGINSFDAK
jgi:hypothetical protein